MKEQFLNYEQSLALKELGFDELCFAYFKDKEFQYPNPYEPFKNSEMKSWCTTAPLLSQAFRWFREKYGLLNHLTTHLNPHGEDGALEESYGYRIMRNNDGWKCSLWEELSNYDNHEEAELECLKKLIEIANERGKKN